MVEGIKKVGEGTFSEIFWYSDDTGTQLVMKVSNGALFLINHPVYFLRLFPLKDILRPVTLIILK